MHSNDLFDGLIKYLTVLYTMHHTAVSCWMTYSHVLVHYTVEKTRFDLYYYLNVGTVHSRQYFTVYCAKTFEYTIHAILLHSFSSKWARLSSWHHCKLWSQGLYLWHITNPDNPLDIMSRSHTNYKPSAGIVMTSSMPRLSLLPPQSSPPTYFLAETVWGSMSSAMSQV